MYCFMLIVYVSHMERLGHKDIKTTLQTYTFNTDVMQNTAVDIFEQSLQA